MRGWVVAVPLFPVVFGAGAVLAAVYARPLARRAALPEGVVFGLLVSLSLVVAATLRVLRIRGGSPGCLVFAPFWGVAGRAELSGGELGNRAVAVAG